MVIESSSPCSSKEFSAKGSSPASLQKVVSVSGPVQQGQEQVILPLIYFNSFIVSNCNVAYHPFYRLFWDDMFFNLINVDVVNDSGSTTSWVWQRVLTYPALSQSSMTSSSSFVIYSGLFGAERGLYIRETTTYAHWVMTTLCVVLVSCWAGMSFRSTSKSTECCSGGCRLVEVQWQGAWLVFRWKVPCGILPNTPAVLLCPLSELVQLLLS